MPAPTPDPLARTFANVKAWTTPRELNPGEIPLGRSLQQASKTNFDLLRNLREGHGGIWSNILGHALPAAAAGAGAAWLGDRLVTGNATGEAAKKKQFWRRALLVGLGGLGAGYAGGSAAWKYKVAPTLKQGLGLSLWNPEKAFARGMDQNYQQNMMRGAEALQGKPATKGLPAFLLEKADSALEEISEPLANTPGIRSVTPRNLLNYGRMFSLPGDDEAYGFRHGVEANSPGIPALQQAYNLEGYRHELKSMPKYLSHGIQTTPAEQWDQKPEYVSGVRRLLPWIDRLSQLNTP